MARQLYDAWGNIRSGGSMPTDIGYTGQRLDTSTGLMYYRARYYAQSLGRFISADTIVPGAGNPQAFNRYSYVNNSPLNLIDPTGHCGFGTQDKQLIEKCRKILGLLRDRYGIDFDVPNFEDIFERDIRDDGTRRWTSSEAQGLYDALDAWRQALGYSDSKEGYSALAEALGLGGMTISAKRGDKLPGDCKGAAGCYIYGTNSNSQIYYSGGGGEGPVGDWAHELAHAWDRAGSGYSIRSLLFGWAFYTNDAGEWVPNSNGEAWTNYAKGKRWIPGQGTIVSPQPMEDFAETARHMVLNTDIAQGRQDSDRYKFLSLFMPGLQK